MTYIVLEMYFALHSQNILSFHYLFIDYSFMKDATQKFMEQMDIIKQFVARYYTPASFSRLSSFISLHTISISADLFVRWKVCPLTVCSPIAPLGVTFFCWLGLIFYEYNKICGIMNMKGRYMYKCY